jgi:hypothetical protein
MVVVAQKIGTLCIEYKPRETIANLVDSEGIFDSDLCNQFLIETKFFAGYEPLLPIYALDPRCYSKLRIKCYSIFDALDFISHLDLQEFKFKFIPAKIYDPINYGDEFDIQEIEFEGALSEGWSMRIAVEQQDEYMFVTNREDARGQLKHLRSVFVKSD